MLSHMGRRGLTSRYVSPTSKRNDNPYLQNTNIVVSRCSLVQHTVSLGTCNSCSIFALLVWSCLSWERNCSLARSRHALCDIKEQCAAQDSCQFWTFREGWARDCYLKRGRRGDPTYTNAVPKVGYVSGTKGDICSCLANSANSDEEVCPISYSR